MRRFNLYLLLMTYIIVMTSCDSKTESGVPNIHPSNVVFSPEKVRRGDIITINYDFYGGIRDLSVDSEGALRYNGDDLVFREEFEGLTDEQRRSFVDFGIKLLEGAEKVYVKQLDGNYSMGYYHDYFVSEKIYPVKYVKFVNGEIQCIVPGDAVSGPIKVDFDGGGSDLGFSEDNLIIVDASGDEIW